MGRGIEQVFRGKKFFRQISPLFHPLLPFVRLFSRLSCDTAIKQRRVGAFHRVTGSDRFLLNTNTDTNYQHRYKCSNNTNVDTNIDTNKVTKTNIDTHTYTNTDKNTYINTDTNIKTNMDTNIDTRRLWTRGPTS